MVDTAKESVAAAEFSVNAATALTLARTGGGVGATPPP